MEIKRLYVGNLPYRATEEDVVDFFAQYGDVYSIDLITDRDTGKPRGFGFVEMDFDTVDVPVEDLDGLDFMGRSLRVNEARAKQAGSKREWYA